jgi:hypothetical protein
MLVTVRLSPFAYPRDRTARLGRLSLAVLAWALLAVWNPVTAPGPTLCGLRHLVGLPCPFCGVTRGVALTLRGRPAEATRYNPLTLPVVALGAALTLLWVLEYALDRRLVVTWRRPARWALFGLVLLAVGAAWVYVLTYRREDDFASSLVGRLMQLLG